MGSSSTNLPSAVTALMVACGLALFIAISRGYKARVRISRLRKQEFPMPPWSWVFGHLLVLRRYLLKYPPDTFFTIVMGGMAADFAETDMFYLDLWPFAPPFLCVSDPDVANQISAKHTFPKADYFNTLFEPLMGGPSLLTTNGQEWKDWRSLFNPAFAHSYLLEQVHGIVDHIEVFCGKLQERVQAGDVAPIEDIATRMTMDTIIKVTLDEEMDYQNNPNAMGKSLREIIHWAFLGNPIYRYHPFRPLVLKYYGSVMNRYIRTALNKRFQEYRAGKDDKELKNTKSVIALAIKAYMEGENEEKLQARETMDDRFLEYATYQLRLFLFAGHDTTTGTLIYTYHELSKHPEILKRMKDEHASVFGSDPTQAPTLMKEQPTLLNQLPYTLAVLKEVMRFYPLSGSIRMGVPDVALPDRHGTQYPTKDFHLVSIHPRLHFNPRLWPNPKEFMPERWLVGPEDPLYPRSGAWRPFEHGPRNCIGQNLSLIELRVALVMTVRTFRIEPAYEEWDAARPQGMIGNLLENLGLKDGRRELDGEMVYPIEKGGSNARDGYPCRITLLEHEK